MHSKVMMRILARAERLLLLGLYLINIKLLFASLRVIVTSSGDLIMAATGGRAGCVSKIS